MFEKIYSLKIFEWLDQKTIDNILNSCQERHYKEGEIILKENTPSNWEWYIIKSWNVSVFIWEKKVANLELGDIFWEMWLLNEEDRNATVVAWNELVLIVLKLEHLIEMINSWSDYINKTIIKRIEENLER